MPKFRVRQKGWTGTWPYARRPRRPPFGLARISSHETRVREYVGKLTLDSPQGTLAEFDAQVSLKEQQLLLKQKREIEALMQRAQRGRDELQLTRKQDVERRSQRFKNVMQELANLHTLESVQLRHYLEQQVVAGKRLDVA